jgi:hypothetical protein
MPRHRAWTPEELFRAVAAYHGDILNSESKRGFGSGALKVNGKIFASLTKGRLLLKLPAAAVDDLIASNKGERFSIGLNRAKREWVTIGPSDTKTWIALSKQARAFVQIGKV